MLLWHGEGGGLLASPAPPLLGGVGSVVFLVLVGAAAPVRCDGLAWILDLSASCSPISPPSSRAVRGLSVASKLEQRDSPGPESIQRERERDVTHTYNYTLIIITTQPNYSSSLRPSVYAYMGKCTISVL